MGDCIGRRAEPQKRGEPGDIPRTPSTGCIAKPLDFTGKPGLGQRRREGVGGALIGNPQSYGPSIAVNRQPVFDVAFWAFSKMRRVRTPLILSDDSKHWMGTSLTCECDVVPEGVAWNVFSFPADTSKPSDLHRLISSCKAAFNALRIHAETVCLLSLAAASTFFRSPGQNLTGTMVPLASPFASLGRPGLLGLGIVLPLSGEASYRSLSNANAKPHDRIPVDSGHALRGPDAGVLGENRCHRDLLVGI
jgi:hypothetical protein